MNCALCETRTMIRTKPITALRPFHGGKTHLAYSPYRSGLTRFSVQLLLRPLIIEFLDLPSMASAGTLQSVSSQLIDFLQT